jgi:predicted nucleic acid-binding protein
VSGHVVDASVAIKMVVAEMGSVTARRLRRDRLVAPDLLWPECANILWKTVRRGDLEPAHAELACSTLLRLPFEITESAELLSDALRRSIALNHPAYDCLYLELAARERLPLITADLRLARLAVPDVEIISLDSLA